MQSSAYSHSAYNVIQWTLSINGHHPVRYPAVTSIWLLSVQKSTAQAILRTTQTLLSSATGRMSESKRPMPVREKGRLVYWSYQAIGTAMYRCVAHKFYAIITLREGPANSRASATVLRNLFTFVCFAFIAIGMRLAIWSSDAPDECQARILNCSVI